MTCSVFTMQFDEADERPLPALANRSQTNMEATNDDVTPSSDGIDEQLLFYLLCD